MEITASFPTLSLAMIGLVTLLTLLFHVLSFNAQTASNAPTILTSLGIFGTFLGVALGLLDFDTENIQASVPDLIDGLKTAFWSSIAGLAGALSIKLRYLLELRRDRASREQIRMATVDDLAQLLAQIRDQQQDANDARHEGEMLAVMKTMQQDNQKQLTTLNQQLGEYQQQMVDANTQALVGALETVMHDFNTRINEQYGENFRHLNEAVGEMLRWQQAYQKQLDTLILQQQKTGDIMQEATRSHERVVEQTKVFSTVSEALEGMLAGLETQSKGLEGYLSALSSLVSNAGEGLPQLEDRFEVLTGQLYKAITTNSEQTQRLLENSSEQFAKAQEALNQQVTQMLAQNEQQVERLDRSMEEELNKALQSFGYQLTALSEKFVSDYAPLTERLREVVAIAQDSEVR
ncbi:hypothetical protein MIB92_12850 [Aestuariirhabdus sp. Z084]|uniref:hypothetical protein n=1 Tax=Aestuariirhabdus haliotis TaxID=2918751 RepID=UPI00201B4121|nr:hypothetical protein [Aestuariirhabdus haliotis]MCL6416541.1 hypothetical protein [Aestuariirhabdus haliotis]MCL6420531.1 hypothetical protein [Aestuariirhabdus haliotis]